MKDAREPGVEWVRDAEIKVEGDPGVEEDRSTWKNIAVLEVHPRAPFLIGWRTAQFAAAEFYGKPVQTDDRGRFAMEVGPEGVWFVARSAGGSISLVIGLVEVTTKDDPKYADLPRY